MYASTVPGTVVPVWCACVMIWIAYVHRVLVPVCVISTNKKFHRKKLTTQKTVGTLREFLSLLLLASVCCVIK